MIIVLRVSSHTHAPLASNGGLSAEWHTLRDEHMSNLYAKVLQKIREEVKAFFGPDTEVLASEDYARLQANLDRWYDRGPQVGSHTWVSLVDQDLTFELLLVGSGQCKIRPTSRKGSDKMATKRDYHDASAHLYEATAALRAAIAMVKAGKVESLSPDMLGELEGIEASLDGVGDAYFARCADAS